MKLMNEGGDYACAAMSLTYIRHLSWRIIFCYHMFFGTPPSCREQLLEANTCSNVWDACPDPQPRHIDIGTAAPAHAAS